MRRRLSAGKFPEQFRGPPRIGGRGFRSGVEVSDVELPSFEPNLSAIPPAGVSKYALDAAPTIPTNPLVTRVESSVADTQIRPTIVEPIHIAMVNLGASGRLQDDSMHPLGSPHSTLENGADSVEPSLFAFRGTPVSILNQRNVRHVYDGLIAARKWNVGNASFNSQGALSHV